MNVIEKVNKIKEIARNSSHTKQVRSLIILTDGRLASASWDKTIRIFNLNNLSCEKIIKTSQWLINNIALLDNGQIISCSFDQSIKIWNINKTFCTCIHTIDKAHSLYITKVISLTKNRIASSSYDSLIKIWNSQPNYNLIQTLKGHHAIIKSMIQIKDKEILLSFSEDKVIIIWNLFTYQCETIITEIIPPKSNGLIQIEENKVLIGGKNKIIELDILNLKINEKIIINETKCICSFLILRDGNILCGCQEGEIVIINIHAWSYQLIKDCHNSFINDIINIDNYKFISCSSDGTIKIWNY